MKGDKIKYRSGYKYQLVDPYTVVLKFVKPREEINTQFIHLSGDGVLTVRPGYAWDGASGPTYDTKNSMRASLVHDALYQLIRIWRLPVGIRDKCDAEFYNMLIEDGMDELRAKIWLSAVSSFGEKAAQVGTDADKPLLTAP